jgi:uncharacterized protein YndB with AHSA1/START domain
VSSCKTQALVQAPVERIWELVGDPNRHPEWWPKVIEVNGDQFEEGTEYVQVTRSAMGRDETTNFLVERRQDLREIRMSCQMSGTYAHWLMTEAQGGTFVDVEFGMEPKTFGLRLFDGAFGRIYFRRWMEQSLEGLKEAAAQRAGAPQS